MNKIEVSDSFLYEFDLDEKIISNALDNFLSLKKYWYSSSYSNNFSKYLTIYYLKKNEGPISCFYDKSLYEKIDECLHEVSLVHFNNQKLSIVDAWWTIAQKGEESILHYHANSLFSGVIYFQESNTPIEFVIDDPFVDKWGQIFKKGVTINPLSYKIRILPKPGKIYIWRSDIRHRVCMHTDNNDRYSFAFNTWLDGNISSSFGGLQKISVQTNYFNSNE